jgi:Mlc titration factor MtfA (ptsG expression regulator)
LQFVIKITSSKQSAVLSISVELPLLADANRERQRQLKSEKAMFSAEKKVRNDDGFKVSSLSSRDDTLAWWMQWKGNPGGDGH